MKITLINTYFKDDPYQASLPPLGLGYIASFLKREMPEVEVSIAFDYDELLSDKPDIIGISSATENFDDAIMLAKKAKEKFDVPIIVGGLHITALPHTLPDSIDIGVLGEGEEVTLQLMRLAKKNQLKPEFLKDVQGICYHDNDKIAVNGSTLLIQNLDDLPLLDRDLFQNKWRMKNNEQVHLISSRGCPYKCTFCISSKSWFKLRCFSPEYVINELEYVLKKYRPEEIYFFDDLFVANSKRFKTIAKMIKDKNLHKGIMFRCYSRVNLMTDEMCEIFKELNFEYIDIGFESNSQKILNYYQKTDATPELNQKAVNMAAKYNISLGGNFIAGAPIETYEDMLETLNFIERNQDKLDRSGLGPLQPLPGTPIWDYALEKGIVSENIRWRNLHYDFQNFDLNQYPILAEKVTKEEFYNVLKLSHYLNGKINWVGYNKKIYYELDVKDEKIKNLENELREIKESKTYKFASILSRLKKFVIKNTK
jgi:radical SAM superfamily enzyme YgiQ (UPF0313 family)